MFGPFSLALLPVGLCLASPPTVAETVAEPETREADSPATPADDEEAADKTEGEAKGKKKKPKLIDPKDGWFDLSDIIAKDQGFMPVPFAITEPAVNYGGGAALLYFVPVAKKLKRDTKTPDVAAVAGFGTGNKSWGVVGAYQGYWLDDRIRLGVVTGYVSANLSFYMPLPGETNFDLNFLGYVFGTRPQFRLGRSPFFLGGVWVMNYIDQSLQDTSLQLDLEATYPLLERFAEGIDVNGDGDLEPINASSSSQGATLLLDTRDNVFTPNKGVLGELKFLYNLPLGEQDQFWQLFLTIAHFHEVAPFLVFGNRAMAALSGAPERIPIYGLPFVSMRGVPLGRFQGQYLLQDEVELRFRVHPRWDVIGLGGLAGTIQPARLVDTTRGELIWAAGGGFRYQLARKLGMSVGVDGAASNDAWAIYTVMGSAW